MSGDRAGDAAMRDDWKQAWKDEVARAELAESRLHLAEKNYERAQKRTFELSEELQRLREESQPLRDLLRRVTLHCIPNFYAMRGDGMDQVWQDVRKATS